MKQEKPSVDSQESNLNKTTQSTTSTVLEAAGDTQSAEDIGALDNAALAVDKKLAATRNSLVERLIYGPAPDFDELQSGGRSCLKLEQDEQPILDVAIDCMAKGEAFTIEGKISDSLRSHVQKEKGYGYTVPLEYGGKGASYSELARNEELLAANGLGALAVEISGQLTIGAGSILGYGSDKQKKTYLPMLVEGSLIGFALTEVGVGVNAKKIQAYVDEDENGDYRLFADGPRNKLWITSATHGGILGLVARKGKDSREIGLFIIQLPEEDVSSSDDIDYEFSCEPSGVDAFSANINSRLHFKNFPIPKQNQIPADGVEVLFYCLRMGRCMLAAMSAGYQRMLARDSSHFAIQRIGVGGPVIKHELPRLAISKMLGGSLQSISLSHLSLQQDSEAVDLAGLRDLTKSAAAVTSQESMIACEHVLGGRSFTKGSRVNDARINLHLFGVVEGEDDMIRMGMVRDITLKFVNEYLSGLLDTLNTINKDDQGNMLPANQRLLRIGLDSFIKEPRRSFKAIRLLAFNPETYKLVGWNFKNIGQDIVRLPLALLPSSMHPRYSKLPIPLRKHVRYAESRLRKLRWIYLGMSMYYQLELTRAQIPLQRFGSCVEHLVSMLVVCQHAAVMGESYHSVAAVQAQLLKDKYRSIRILTGISEMEELRRGVANIGDEIENDELSMFENLVPEQFSHDWSEK